MRDTQEKRAFGGGGGWFGPYVFYMQFISTALSYILLKGSVRFCQLKYVEFNETYKTFRGSYTRILRTWMSIEQGLK